MKKRLSDLEISEIYSKIKRSWKENLEKYGVILPKLKNKTNYVKDSLVLIYLYNNIGKAVSKTELTSFIKQYYPDTNDVQQARHLGQQKGWFILSGTRGDIEAKEHGIKAGEYMLVTLETHYPDFTKLRGIYEGDKDLWGQVKETYNYRCATCGSEEGKPNINYQNSITKLQKGHKDPSKSLTENNIIPQCEKCNRPDRNYFIYDNKGRVVKIADSSFILKSSDSVQIETLKHLLKKFPSKAKEFLKLED